jgi:hypothetical protein
MSARTWSRTADAQQQAQTLAGLHADYTLFLLDETGGMPIAVMAAAEAALSTGKECHIVQAGNPTEIGGALYNSCVRQRHLWLIFEISGDPDDPKRATRVGVQWARDQIATWGRDNPFVLEQRIWEVSPWRRAPAYRAKGSRRGVPPALPGIRLRAQPKGPWG